MSTHTFQFAVRLIGFSAKEEAACDAAFAQEREMGSGYCRLVEGNLQDPDMFVANAADLRALVILADLRPSDLRPALLVGTPALDLPYPRIEWPIDWTLLLTALDGLVEKRADALSHLEASDIVVVPERRRSNRLDLDLTDPSEYQKMRAKVHDDGVVLVVDKAPMLYDYLSGFLARHQVPVEWVRDEVGAVQVCRQKPVSVVMINTSTPHVDPYRLCWAIKEKNSPVKIAVIFLIGKPYIYDMEQAEFVGAEGFLMKPLSSQHLISVLKKFLPRLL